MPLDRYDRESLSHDPIHGYIAFTAAKDPALRGRRCDRLGECRS